MYNTVIFDLDGTILNTLEDLADSVNYALGSFGYPLRSIDEVREFVGNGIKKLIERAVPCGTDEQQTDKVLDVFKQHYGQNSDIKTKAYDGICEMISNLKKAGIKTAVVTNKAHFAAVPLCKKYFDGLIDVTIGEREGVRKKPYPDSVFEALEQLGASKQNTIYVGDSDVDINTAKNAGVDCVCVDWGFRSREFLIKSGATSIVSDAQSLYEFITKK